MNLRIAPRHRGSCHFAVLQQRAPSTILGVLVGVFLTNPVFAGGADVSTDELYSDGVTLTTLDGSPLDIDGDGNTDLAIASNRGAIGERSRYYPGNGDGTFGTPVLLTIGASSQIVFGDLGGATADVDLVQARRDLTDLFYGADGAGGFNAAADVTADTWRTLSVALGDLDNDGDLDIVTSNGRFTGSAPNPPQANRFYLNDFVPGGTTAFVGADISADLDDTRGIALADLDLDGDLDVIVGNDETTVGSNRVYLNQFVPSATVSFAAGVDFGPADDQTSAILVGDLDNDGDMDIVTVNNTQAGLSPGINRFFLNQSTIGSLVLSAAMDVSTDTDPSSGGTLADFDGDGDLDFVVANLLPTAAGESGRNRLYLNQFIESGTVSFAAGIDISPDEQASRELAAADINGDGNIDIVVGNQDNITGVSGRDRRYLNNGSADPFLNIAPLIDAQATALDTDEETDLTIILDDVLVDDADNVFPDDFTLTVQTATGYSVSGNTITPDAGFSGGLTVPVVVSDGTDDSDAFDLTVTVNDTINNTPAFTSTPVTVANEAVAYTYNVTASDLDVTATLAITAPTLPAWLTLTDNGDGTATLTGTPGAGDVGPNDVSLQVSDGTASMDQNFTITVAAGSGGNTAPAFTSTPVTTASAGTAYSYDVVASDPDTGDTLDITAPTLPTWLTFTDNGDGTATLSGTPAAGDAGDHDVSLEVSDGTDTATQDFTIAVSGGTSGNTAPSFSSTPVTDATEDTTYTYEVTGTDPDTGDTLAITGSTLPSWLTLTDNGDGTATLTGTPAAADAGEHAVSLEVSDGIDSATQDFTITVVTAAPPPTFPPPHFGGGGGSTELLSLLAMLGCVTRRKIAASLSPRKRR